MISAEIDKSGQYRRARPKVQPRAEGGLPSGGPAEPPVFGTVSSTSPAGDAVSRNLSGRRALNASALICCHVLLLLTASTLWQLGVFSWVVTAVITVGGGFWMGRRLSPSRLDRALEAYGCGD